MRDNMPVNINHPQPRHGCNSEAEPTSPKPLSRKYTASINSSDVVLAMGCRRISKPTTINTNGMSQTEGVYLSPASGLRIGYDALAVLELELKALAIREGFGDAQHR